MGSSLNVVISAAAVVLSALFPPAAPWIMGVAGLIAGFIGGDRPEEAPEETTLKLNDRSTQRIIPLIYGTRLVGSNDVYVEMTREGKHSYIWCVSVLAEGVCAGFSDQGTDIFIEDKTLDDFNDEYREEDDPADVVQAWFMSGSEGQGVEPHIYDAIPAWDDPMKGVSYIVYKILWKEGVFYSIPPRTHRLTGKTSNPAVALLDYFNNSVYGLGLSGIQLDQATFDEAAQYCIARGWVLNYAVTSRRKAQDIIDTILFHFRGQLSWYSGIVYLKYADLSYETIAGAISDLDIGQEENGKAMVAVKQPGVTDIPDGYIVKYVNPAKNWTIDDFSVGEKDGKIDVINFMGYTDRSLAVKMAEYLLERNQYSRAYSFTLKPSNIAYDVYDLVQISCSELGWTTPQLCRVVQSNILSGGAIAMSVIIEKADFYNKFSNANNGALYGLDFLTPYDMPPPVEEIAMEEIFVTDDKVTENNVNIRWNYGSSGTTGAPYPYTFNVDTWMSYEDVPTWEEVVNWTYVETSTSGEVTIRKPRQGIWVWFRMGTRSSTGLSSKALSFEYTRYYVEGRTLWQPPEISTIDMTVNSNEATFSYNLLNITREEALELPDLAGYELRLTTTWVRDTWIDALIVDMSSYPVTALSGLKPRHGQLWIAQARTVGTNGNYGGIPARLEFSTGSTPAGYDHSDFVDFDMWTIAHYVNAAIHNEFGYDRWYRSGDASLSFSCTTLVDTNYTPADPTGDELVWLISIDIGYAMRDFHAATKTSNVIVTVDQATSVAGPYAYPQGNLHFFTGIFRYRFIRVTVEVTDSDVGSKMELSGITLRMYKLGAFPEI